MDNISISTTWIDRELLELYIILENKNVTSSTKLYSSKTALYEDSIKLRNWSPKQVGNVISIELGQSDLSYFEIQFQLINSLGHVLIVAEMGEDNEFAVRCKLISNLSSVKSFGNNLTELYKSNSYLLKLNN